MKRSQVFKLLVSGIIFVVVGVVVNEVSWASYRYVIEETPPPGTVLWVGGTPVMPNGQVWMPTTQPQPPSRERRATRPINPSNVSGQTQISQILAVLEELEKRLKAVEQALGISNDEEGEEQQDTTQQQPAQTNQQQQNGVSNELADRWKYVLQALSPEEQQEFLRLMEMPHKKIVIRQGGPANLNLIAMMETFYYQISWEEAEFIVNCFNKAMAYNSPEARKQRLAQRGGNLINPWQSQQQISQILDKLDEIEKRLTVIEKKLGINNGQETETPFEDKDTQEVSSSSIIETQGYIPPPLSVEQNIVNWKNEILEAASYNDRLSLEKNDSLTQLDTYVMINETIKKINRRLKRIEEELNK